MRALTSPMHRSLLICAPFAILALFVSACGGAADYTQREMEPPRGGSVGYATSPAPTGTPIAAEAEAPSFMRVGEVANAPVPPAAPIVAVATSSAAPVGGVPPQKNGTKTSTSDPSSRPTEKKPDSDARGTDREHPPTDGKPEGGVHGAVVDSASSLTEAEVRSTIVSRQSSFRECYDLGGANFAGSVSLRVSIGPTGTVASVDVLASTTKSAPVDSCVSGAVRRLQFPAKGAGAVVAFPIEFGR